MGAPFGNTNASKGGGSRGGSSRRSSGRAKSSSIRVNPRTGKAIKNANGIKYKPSAIKRAEKKFAASKVKVYSPKKH